MSEYIMFWKLGEPNERLSQWYPSKIVENDITFCNAEQYMMYHKAILFGDIGIAKKIIKSKCPKTIKALGRKITNFDEDIWAENRERIIQQGNYLKFSQNDDLKGFLLSCPKNCIFVETSPFDRIYGVGYDEKTALYHRSKWGLNLLGKALNITYNKFLN